MIYIATYIRKLKDRNGNYITPATRSKGVYMEDNTTLSLLSSYPVGSIYQSVNTTSPASLFGGSWEKIEGRFLLGSSSEYELGDTGGEAEHTMKWREMAYHNHGIYVHYGNSGDATDETGSESVTAFNNELYKGILAWTNRYRIVGMSVTNNPAESMNETNLQEPMPIMPLYYCVNIWRRTA